MTRIITIANQKGGVGKTTTAINLSAGIAMSGRKVLMIDLDPQGNATTGVGLPKAMPEYSSTTLFTMPEAAASLPVESGIPNLYVIEGAIALLDLESTLADAPDKLYRLRESCSNLKDGFSVIIIDCPPTLGLMTMNALIASDYLLVPIQCEYFSMEGLTQILKVTKDIRLEANTSLELCGILFTMYTPGLKLAEVRAEVVKHFQREVYSTVIARDVALSEAQSFAKTIFDYAPRSVGAKNYIELTKEVLKQWAKDI
ncbi:MAG: ParA family protein [Candidatus Brocadiia bacterium]